MAGRVNLKLSEDELARLIDSYFVLGDFLEEAVGPERIYNSAFVKSMKEAISDCKKDRTKRIRSIHDFLS